MAGLRLGGLSSGLDTESLIAQLMAVERTPRMRAEIRQQVVEARKSTLSDIQSRLRALQTAIVDLRSPALYAPTQTVESSDPSRVAVTRTGGVGTGAYMVRVEQVAGAEQRSYAYTKQSAESTITVDGHEVIIPADAELADVIAKVNGDANGKVWASDVGGRLAFSWRETGQAATDDVVSAAALSDEQLLRAGRNARLYVDGVLKEPAGNVFTEIPGLELTIKAPTSADVAITVGPPGLDAEKVTEKVKAFVEAYNAANDLMRNELREERVRDAGNRVDRSKGVLRGDPAIAALQSRLRQALSTTIDTGSTAADQLADLGISTGKAAGDSTFSKDSIDGKLVLDETALAATLAAEPTRVQQLLGADGAGIAQKFEAILAPALGGGGEFETRMQSADVEAKRLKDSMTALDERLALRERALRAMFSRLEQGLQAANAQGSFLGAQLNALNTR